MITLVEPETDLQNTGDRWEVHIICCKSPFAICGEELDLSANIGVSTDDNVEETTCVVCYEVIAAKAKCSPTCEYGI